MILEKEKVKKKVVALGVCKCLDIKILTGLEMLIWAGS